MNRGQACQRNIELNPLRAGMVTDPGDYHWSSYRANAQCVADNLVKPHERYLALGRKGALGESACRELFRAELEPETVDEIRIATNGNHVLGDSTLANQITQALGHQVQPGTPGRPRKTNK